MTLLGRAPRATLVALVALTAVALAACGGASTATAPADAPAGAQPPSVSGDRPPATDELVNPSFRATGIGATASIPTGLVEPPGGRYLLVGVVTGQVAVVELAKQDGLTVPVPTTTPWLDLSDRTLFDGENRGLLGLALVDNGRRIAVSYTSLDGEITVETFPWNNRPTGDLASGAVAIRVPHPLAGLSGGGIATLPEGDLVLGIGDMDDRFSQPPSAQNPSSPLGSLLRVPAAALRGGATVAVEPSMLLAKGLRNPWGVSADAATGDVWTGDVGDARVEEIDRVPGDHTGAPVNFGWPWLEGALAGVSGQPREADLTPPVIAAPHRYKVCSIVGGVVYRGRQLPGLEGAYLYGDLCSDEVHALLLRDGKAVMRRVVGKVGGKVVGFGTDRHGEVYVLGLDGKVARLDPVTWNVPSVSGPIGPPAAPGESTTTAPSGPPPAKCGIIDVFTTLEPITTLTPDQVRERVVRVRKLLDAAEASTTGQMQKDVATYRLYIEEWIAFGERRGWDFSDPELAGYFGKVTAGSGKFADAPALVDRLIAGLNDCPGERL